MVAPKLKMVAPKLKMTTQKLVRNEERTPAQGDKSFDIMRPGGKNSPYNKDGTKKSPPKSTKTGKPKLMADPVPMPEARPKPKPGQKPPVPMPEAKPKPHRKPPVQMPDMGKEPKKSRPAPKKEPKYNPYGKGTANPTNMSGSTGP